MNFTKICGGLFFVSLFPLTNLNAATTVIITHGMGTDGISFYQKSDYIDAIKETAKSLGYKVRPVKWLSTTDHNNNYAGLLPQERIKGATTIAKEILKELGKKNDVILIGHGYGGQVMRCACRLLNPKNKEVYDSIIYDLIQIIKTLLSNQDKSDQRSLTEIVGAIATGWQITQSLINFIESTNVVNENIINYVKQNISLATFNETKNAWNTAFEKIAQDKKILFKQGFNHQNCIKKLYTIGTIHNGSSDEIFSEDMDVIKNYLNFYSTSDNIATVLSNRVSKAHQRASNINVLIEPEKASSPQHKEFCGNIQMAPWLLVIPEMFKQFKWGQDGEIYFFKSKKPEFKTIKL
jgi:hypothetical protein